MVHSGFTMPSKAQILVVDDMPEVQRLLGRVLRSTDYELTYANDGVQALELASRILPDLVLLDVLLPEMDGFEVCRRLRADPRLREVPIIMMTGAVDDVPRLRGIEAGADDFVPKPFNRLELRARVDNIVRLNRYRRLYEERARFQRIIQYRLRLEEAISEASQQLMSPQGPDIVSVLCQFGEAVGADRTSLYRYADECETLQREWQWEGEDVGPEHPSIDSLCSDVTPWLIGQIGRGETVVVENVDTLGPESNREKELFRKCGIRSAVHVPIRLSDNTLFGSLSFELIDMPRRWSDQDTQMLSAAAGMLGSYFERKQVEQALRQERAQLAERVRERTAELSAANTQLERASRMKDEFLANMSHELRTPLNAVLSLCEGLQEEIYAPLAPKQRQAVAAIEESGRHLLSLINDILDLSKIEAGKMVLDCETFSARKICESSLQIIRQMARKRKMELSLAITPPRAAIRADRRGLKQILTNLLSNAVKFTPAGGSVALDVQCDAATEVATFTVEDTGIGIREQDMATLFKPFEQIEHGLARTHEGTGLGLALVSRLAELHGGSIAVDSVFGKGSRFIVRLPWGGELCGEKEAEDDAAAIEAGSTPARAPDDTDDEHPTVAGSAPLILLAEDNELNILGMLDYLEKRGLRVILARNGREAVSQALEESPDLILMDVQMPEMDGLEAIARIRTRESEEGAERPVPIIALTALAMPGDEQRCLSVGATGYLSKPVRLKELIGIITEQLSR